MATLQQPEHTHFNIMCVRMNEWERECVSLQKFTFIHLIYGYVEYNAVLHYLYEFDHRQNGFVMRANEWNECGTNGESVVESSRAQKAKGNYSRMEISSGSLRDYFEMESFGLNS